MKKIKTSIFSRKQGLFW